MAQETEFLKFIKLLDDNDCLSHVILVGSGAEVSVNTNLGVTAQSLRHLDILSKYTKITEFFGMNIEIPLPEAFIIHKIIINNDRAKKKEKDRISINSIYKHINKNKFYEIFNTLTQKEQKIVEKYINNNI